jgi:hypothetical protein
VVSKVEQRDCELLIKGHLILRSITHEDGIIFDPCDKGVECLGIDV